MNSGTGLPNKKITVFLIIWALACGLGLYVRLYPFFNNTSSEASDRASLLVITNLRKMVSQQIEAAHPDLSPLEKQKLLNTEVNQILHGQNTKVRQTIDQVAKTIDHQMTDRPKYPYLLASDSYYYFDLTQTIARTGKISDQIHGSKYFNRKMSAPLGYWEPLNLHPYVGYFVYQILSHINPEIPLMFAVSFTPLVMMTLCALPLLWLSFYYWKCSPLVSFVSTVFFLMAPIFVKRSTFAWYDDDSYSLFFPLLILAIIFVALQRRKNLKSMFRWTALGCVMMSLYALFWHGWVFLLSVLIISGFAIIPWNYWILKKKSETKNLLLCFGLLSLGSLLSISVVFGPSQFFILFQEGWTALNDFLTPKISLWPDLYIAVGELLSAPFSTTVNMAGGSFFIIVAFLGLFVSLFRTIKNRAENIYCETIILGILLSFTVFLALGAQRFILLCVVPLSILFSLGMKYLFEWAEHCWTKKLPPTDRYRKAFLVLMTVIALGLVGARVRASYLEVPSLLNHIFNDVWAKAFRQVQEKTPPDSIINTWWPPGHFIKAMADRRVTFDGATINKPQAYWLANVLLSSDERTALGFLRMLNNSANQATEYLQSLGMPLSKTVRLLKEITPLNEEHARQKIGSRLTEEQTKHLLSLTHKLPPPSYLLIYTELVQGNIQLSFVGNWDFEKAEELNKNHQYIARVPAKHSHEYVSFLWSMSGGQPRYSENLNLQAESDQMLLFDENVQIDLRDMTCKVNSFKFGSGTPLSIFYDQGDHVAEKILPHSNLSYSVLYSRQENTHECVLLERAMAKSLLMKMYFFNGKGLRYFRPIVKETDLTKRTRIYIYAVDWEQFRKDLDTAP